MARAPRPLPRPRRDADARPARSAPVADRVDRGAARPRARGRRGRRRRGDRLERREPLRAARADGGGHAALPLRAHGHRAAGSGRSSRWSRTASSGTPAGRSSAPTTSRRSWRWSRRRGGCVEENRPARRARAPVHAEGGGRPARRRRRSTARGSPPGSATSTTRRGRSARSILGAPYSMIDGGHVPRPAPRTPGWRPEEGRSAIAAAARAIADMRLGRLDEETTANVGADRGRDRRATSSPTAARSSPRRARTTSGSSPTSSRRCSTPARSPPRSTDCEVETRGRARLPAATASRRTTSRCGSPSAALERAGHEPSLRALRRRRRRERLQHARPRRASTSRTGWRRSTRPQEHIAVADLEAMVDVTLALLEERASAA